MTPSTEIFLVYVYGVLLSFCYSLNRGEGHDVRMKGFFDGMLWPAPPEGVYGVGLVNTENTLPLYTTNKNYAVISVKNEHKQWTR